MMLRVVLGQSLGIVGTLFTLVKSGSMPCKNPLRHGYYLDTDESMHTLAL